MKRYNPNYMSNAEYKRRVFNECMLAGMDKIHGQILNGNIGCECTDDRKSAEMASKMCRAFFADEMKLDNSTISQTKQRLSESVTFVHDLMDISENIAEQKAADCAEAGCEMDTNQKIELSEEDNALMDKLFEEKNPTMQVDQIRDTTVKALLAEDEKAQEIKDAMNIANSQVAAGEDPKVLKETMDRLEKIGPVSLMNAIMNSVATDAIRDVNENINRNGKPIKIGEIMQENAQEIKNRAVMLYTLYETSNVFGIVHRTNRDVQALASKIYYGK